MKLIQALLEQESILRSRRSRERAEKYDKIVNEKIQQYIKDGSKGDLDLKNAPITSLRSDLKYVGGDLNLYNSAIKSLPNNLEVKGHLTLGYTPINSLPNNLKVGKSLNLTSSEIKSLPDNLQVDGSLWILNTPLARKYSDEEIKNLAKIKGVIFRI